jgi:hypothetical protein
MNALLTKIQAPAKQLWHSLATHQNRGIFTAQQQVQVPAHADPRVRLPQGLDLRASGPGFDNLPARFEIAPTGEASVVVGERSIALGDLSCQSIETGWMITGLRLRGAVRFSAQKVILLVPDREDVPYLLRVLAPHAAAPAQALPYRQVLAA